MKDNPRTPLEKAGDWIEYVHRHGGAQHLRAQVFNIPWYQDYLLDVIAFLVAIVALVVMVIMQGVYAKHAVEVVLQKLRRSRHAIIAVLYDVTECLILDVITKGDTFKKFQANAIA